MQITFEVPDDLAAQLTSADQDPARTALEAIAIEAYRAHRLTGYQWRQLLGIPSNYDLDGFLKKHQVWLEFSIGDFERERALSGKLWQLRQDPFGGEAEQCAGNEVSAPPAA
jgi:hypothetical protein